MRRRELEVEISPAQFEALWPATEGRRIEKTRRTMALAGPPGGLAIEVDEYAGALAGLCVAEVEFGDEAAAAAFSVPPWFGRDVTDDEAYKNRRLALDGLPSG